LRKIKLMKRNNLTYSRFRGLSFCNVLLISGIICISFFSSYVTSNFITIDDGIYFKPQRARYNLIYQYKTSTFSHRFYSLKQKNMNNTGHISDNLFGYRIFSLTLTNFLYDTLRQRNLGNTIINYQLNIRGGSNDDIKHNVNNDKNITSTKETKFSKVVHKAFPLYHDEIKKFITLSTINFFIILAVTLTRDIKDTMVVTQVSGTFLLIFYS